MRAMGGWREGPVREGGAGGTALGLIKGGFIQTPRTDCQMMTATFRVRVRMVSSQLTKFPISKK